MNPTNLDAPFHSGSVLVANDHEWTARSMEAFLTASGFTVIRTFTGAETLREAERRRPEVFILDHQLPDISGLEVCRQLREHPAFGPSTPMVLTTAGPSGRSQRLDAYTAGAWEFFGQPLDGEALLRKVKVFMAARQETLRIAREGMVEPATGLYNRLGLQRRATELAALSRRNGAGLACVALAPDVIDGEDDLVRRIGEVLRTHSRAADAAGRLAPSAFAVVGTTDRAGAEQLAARLRAALGDAGAVRFVVITAAADGKLPLDPEQLLQDAAVALAA